MVYAFYDDKSKKELKDEIYYGYSLSNIQNAVSDGSSSNVLPVMIPSNNTMAYYKLTAVDLDEFKEVLEKFHSHYRIYMELRISNTKDSGFNATSGEPYNIVGCPFPFKMYEGNLYQIYNGQWELYNEAVSRRIHTAWQVFPVYEVSNSTVNKTLYTGAITFDILTTNNKKYVHIGFEGTNSNARIGIKYKSTGATYSSTATVPFAIQDILLKTYRSRIPY